MRLRKSAEANYFDGRVMCAANAAMEAGTKMWPKELGNRGYD